MKNIFVWCDNAEDLNHFSCTEKDKVYIASLNIDESAQCFEQTGWNYVDLDYTLDVSQETSDIIEKINCVARNTEIGIYANLYEMSYIVEGGEAQTINDFLFYLYNFDRIIKKYSINKVLSSTIVRQAYLVLKVITKANNIEFKSFNESINKAMIKAYMNKNSLPIKLYWKKSQADILNRIRQIKRRSKRIESKFDVVLFSSWIDKKHVRWNVSMLELLDKSIDVGVISFTGDEYNEEFASRGYTTVNAEAWFEESQAASDIRIWKANCEKIETSKRMMKPISLGGYDVTDVIWGNYQRYLYKRVFRTIIYRGIIHNMLNDVFFKAGIVCLDSNYPLNRAIYYTALNEYNRHISLCKNEAQLIPYLKPPWKLREPYKNIIQYYFHSKPDVLSLNKINDLEWSGKIIWIPMGMKSSGNSFEDETQVVQINRKPIILWCPTYVLVGYDSFKDNQLRSDTVLETCNELGLQVYVKYHPGQSLDQTEKFRKRYAHMYNVNFIDQKESINTWYTKADIIISDLSTTLFEAASIGKPVISIMTPFLMSKSAKGILDNYLVSDTDNFKNALIRLTNSMTGNDSIDFYKNVISRQNSSLRSWYYDPDYLSFSDGMKMVLREWDKKESLLQAN